MRSSKIGYAIERKKKGKVCEVGDTSRVRRSG